LAGCKELWIGMVPRARAGSRLGYKSAALRARRDGKLATITLTRYPQLAES